MDALLLGMASQIAEREDHVVVEDVRGEAEAVSVAPWEEVWLDLLSQESRVPRTRSLCDSCRRESSRPAFSMAQGPLELPGVA